jgi:hypothetical protein
MDARLTLLHAQSLSRFTSEGIMQYTVFLRVLRFIQRDRLSPAAPWGGRRHSRQSWSGCVVSTIVALTQLRVELNAPYC